MYVARGSRIFHSNGLKHPSLISSPCKQSAHQSMLLHCLRIYQDRGSTPILVPKGCDQFNWLSAVALLRAGPAAHAGIAPSLARVPCRQRRPRSGGAPARQRGKDPDLAAPSARQGGKRTTVVIWIWLRCVHIRPSHNTCSFSNPRDLGRKSRLSLSS